MPMQTIARARLNFLIRTLTLYRVGTTFNALSLLKVTLSPNYLLTSRWAYFWLKLLRPRCKGSNSLQGKMAFFLLSGGYFLMRVFNSYYIVFTGVSNEILFCNSALMNGPLLLLHPKRAAFAAMPFYAICALAQYLSMPQIARSAILSVLIAP